MYNGSIFVGTNNRDSFIQARITSYWKQIQNWNMIMEGHPLCCEYTDTLEMPQKWMVAFRRSSGIRIQSNFEAPEIPVLGKWLCYYSLRRLKYEPGGHLIAWSRVQLMRGRVKREKGMDSISLFINV